MLGADAGIIEAGTDGMNVGGLPVFVLKNVGNAAVQNPRLSCAERGGMLPERTSAAARFDTNELHILIINERMEDARRVAAATDAGDDAIGKTAFDLHALLARLATDARLEISHHFGKRMRPG